MFSILCNFLTLFFRFLPAFEVVFLKYLRLCRNLSELSKRFVGAFCWIKYTSTPHSNFSRWWGRWTQKKKSNYEKEILILKHTVAILSSLNVCVYMCLLRAMIFIGLALKHFHYLSRLYFATGIIVLMLDVLCAHRNVLLFSTQPGCRIDNFFTAPCIFARYC